MTHRDFVGVVAQEFELAFLSTGLKPVRRKWGDGLSNGCMVTALDVGEHGAAKAITLMEEVRLPFDRMTRVVNHLSARFPQFRRSWWRTFVAYGVLAYDGCATSPSRWLAKHGASPLGNKKSSAKLLGAAVGKLVFANMSSASQCEVVPATINMPVCQLAG